MIAQPGHFVGLLCLEPRDIGVHLTPILVLRQASLVQPTGRRSVQKVTNQTASTRPGERLQGQKDSGS